MYKSEAYKKEKKLVYKKDKRFNGERIYYFLLHNILSMIMFFSIAYAMDLFDSRAQSFQDVFYISFVELVVYVLAINILTGIVSRFISYVVLYLLIEKWRKKKMKKFGEINIGIDAIDFNYILSNILGSILFSVGAVIIIQVVVFGEITVLSFVLSYLIMKIFVYVLIKVLNQLG